MAARGFSINRIFGRAFLWLPAALAGLWALHAAYRLRWTADDAFISFRYARAAASGAGLTFNPGERVEGYTNFLWTILLIPIEALKLNVETAAWGLGLAAFAGTLWFSYLQMKRDAVWPGFFAALCLVEHLHVFATSGLETSLFTFLITAGLAVVVRHIWEVRARTGFLLLALAALTRPDGLLLYGTAAVCAGIASLRHKRAGWIFRQVRTHAWALLILVPVWTAKSVYYGDVVPNTFHAKSAAEGFLQQGFTYAALFAESYWLLCLLTAAAVALPSSWRSPRAVHASAISAWTLYVIYVGGDFMFARFFVPVIPASLLLLQETAADLLRDRKIAAGFLYTSLCLSLLVRPDPFQNSIIVGQISEEHRIYTRGARQTLRQTAEELRPAMITSGARLGFVGAQAAFMYYWYPLFAIESETGLTDRAIARQVLAKRGKIGHEKQASYEYLKARGVHILMRPRPAGWPDSGDIEIRGIPGSMTLVDSNPSVITSLQNAGALSSIRLPSGL